MDDSEGAGFRPRSTRLDLRGYRGEEAVKEVAHFIDEAVVSGLTSLEIIHGKGEGILRKLIHEYLGQRSEVKNFELAPWEQGGPGCTLVTLG
jgi:DNA mismatch repair protein MutS2